MTNGNATTASTAKLSRVAESLDVGRPGASPTGYLPECTPRLHNGKTTAVTRLDSRPRRAVFVVLILVLVVAGALVFYVGERDANQKDCISVSGHFPDPVTSEMVRC